MSQFFDFAAETFRLQLEGMGSERAPATPAMRGSPRPANDALPQDCVERDRFLTRPPTDELETLLWEISNAVR